MTTSNISKFNRLVMGVAVAALIAASCGSDESAVVEPAEPAPVETTAPTTAPATEADVGEPATVEDADTTVEGDEAPATTTTAAEVPSEEAVDEDPPAGTTGEEPADEQEQPVTAEPEPSATTPTSVPVVVEDLGIADRALAFLAGELGVPESEITLTGTETAVWTDTSLGCPKEGYAYAAVLTPGYEFTFSHGTASHVVHTDELGTYFVRPVGCYEPTEPELTTTTQPEPTPETTLPPEEPVEQAPDDTSTTAIPEPEQPVDPWERVANEPVLASELWPEGDPEGNPYPNDLYCHVPSDGEFECYYTTPEPEPVPDAEPEPEPVVEGNEYDAFVQAVQLGQTWTSSEAPPVHPSTPATSWDRDTHQVGYQPDDRPRVSSNVQIWIDWCGNHPECDRLLLHMVWALDYLGANEVCVIEQYFDYALSTAQYPQEMYGWHNCATIIDPVQSDGKLLSEHGLSMAERCRAVLPDDVELEERISSGVIRDGLDCDEWGAWVEARRVSYPACDKSARLAEEWLEHYIGMPERYWRMSC